jgi:large repetitive protein
MRWLLLLVPLAGCIDISPADGTVRCNPNGKACPDNYSCASDGFCRRQALPPDMSVNDNDMSGSDGMQPPDMTLPPDMTPACALITVSTLAGTGVAGANNGAGNVATFQGPEGITVDPNGTLYVADTGNNLVRKVLSDGTTSTFAGPADFLTLKRMTFSFYVYVVDHGHDNLRRIDPSGAVTTDFYLGAMTAVALRPSGGTYVTNTYQVAKYNSGTSATPFSGDFPGGFVDGPAATAKYGSPVDLQFDGDDTLYVADEGNHRIRKVKVSAGTDNGDVTTLAGQSMAGHLDGVGAAAQFEGPNGIAVDKVQHLLYVTDVSTIRVVTAAGNVTTLAGSTPAITDGNACVAKFISLKGIALFGNVLYVVDVNRIRKIQLP